MNIIWWTILMLLTASGLFFTRKIGELKKEYVRRMSVYYSRKIKKYELLSNVIVFGFMALTLWVLAAKQLEGNEIILALMAGYALFETVRAFYRRRLIYLLLWGATLIAIWAYLLFKSDWLVLVIIVLMVISWWIKIWNFYKH